jgi:hypothetical protein
MIMTGALGFTTWARAREFKNSMVNCNGSARFSGHTVAYQSILQQHQADEIILALTQTSAGRIMLLFSRHFFGSNNFKPSQARNGLSVQTHGEKHSV